jgi:hypothetical protein
VGDLGVFPHDTHVLYVRNMSFLFQVQIICGRPVIISSLKLDPDKLIELTGVGLTMFSSCGHFLATQADRMPAAIWIWSIKQMKLHSVIVHKQPVTGNQIFAG